MESEWIPGQRKRLKALQKPLAGVPDHLALPLLKWIDEELQSPTIRAQLAVDMQWSDLPDYWARYRSTGASEEIARRVKQLPAITAAATLLDVVEWCLEYGEHVDVREIPADDAWGSIRKVRGAALEGLLARGNSAYRVRTDGRGLEFRISAEAIRQFETTVKDANSSAADHLINAWNGAYALSPDPAKSVSEAVKAIEAAYEHLVSPRNERQTLGTMIRDIRAAPQKWTFVLNDHADADGVAMVVAMMNQVWKNQQRHATGPSPRTETVDEAQCAVHIAGALVQFVSGGAFLQVS